MNSPSRPLSPSPDRRAEPKPLCNCPSRGDGTSGFVQPLTRTSPSISVRAPGFGLDALGALPHHPTPVVSVESAIRHYRLSDLPMFRAGYTALLGNGVTPTRILEVCCGRGDLSGWLAEQSPDARVVAMDRSEEYASEARARHGHLPNLEILVGDVLNLSSYEAGSFDLVVGQATLHHLAHDLGRASREFSRILKPGGRCVFIYEPFGHNPLFAAIRAVHISMAGWPDECNLFERQLQDFATNFSRLELQPFNLFGYWAKALPNIGLARSLGGWLAHLDASVFRRLPRSRKYAANFNVIFVK
jgi:ubiquinone/menaquinone biosynthesis C-methylase UbiE